MSNMVNQLVWEKGESSRPFQLRRPCECGCDFRGGVKGVGYLTGSDFQGHGFTIWIETEEVYQAVLKSIETRGIA